MHSNLPHRAVLMRFLSRFNSKKLRDARPELVKAFESKSERQKLFVSFFLNEENMDAVQLMHCRSQIQTKKARSVGLVKKHTDS